MVNIKKKALKALRATRPRVFNFESGHVAHFHAGPYLVGVDLARADEVPNELYEAMRSNVDRMRESM